MKKYLIYLIIISSLTSCVTYYPIPRYFRKHVFNSVYTGDSTLLSEKLNINGYYTVNDTMNSGWIAHGYMNMIFFNDGMFVTGFHSFGDSSFKFDEVIPNYIENVNKVKEKGKRHYGFYESECWGFYEVQGDIIKAKHIFRAEMSGQIGNSGSEMVFKIIDRNSIIEIENIPINESESDYNAIMRKNAERDNYKLYFRPLKEMPESDGWMKYKEWFWKDKAEFEIWIENKDRFNF